MANAWYLPFDGINQQITVPSAWSFVNTGDFIEWDIDFDAVDSTYGLCSDGAFGEFFQYESARWRLRKATSGTIYELFISKPTGRVVVRLERISGGYELFYDGVSQGTLLEPSLLAPTVLCEWLNGVSVKGDVYTIKRNVSGSDVNLLKNSIDATQAGFPDQIAGGVATLTGFSSPPPWVLYDDGGGGTGVTADVIETAPSFTDAINATLTKALTASITELAPSFADAIESTLTGNTTANITGLAPSFADSISATLTGQANAVQITELLPAFEGAINATLTGNQSATITEVAPSFSASITATTFPAGVTAASITELAPSFTTAINATLTGNTTAQINALAPAFSDIVNASLSVRIDGRINELAPAFSASLTATVPSKWIDVVVPDATWTDKTITSAPWINIR